MQRGSQLYKTLFDEPVLVTAPEQPSLRQLKTDCILDFYYFNGRKEVLVNGKPIRMNYTSLLELVSTTFFLSTFTVYDIIQSNSERIALMKQEWKDKPAEKLQKHFEKKWPHLVW